MKKQLFVLLVAVLFATGALAEGTIYAEGTDALLKNPRDAYEYDMDTTDGSDQLVFMMLDIQNDEETLTADGSAIVATVYVVSEDGALSLIWRTFAFQTDYGKAFREDYGTDDPALYSVGERACLVQKGIGSLRMSEYGTDDLETVWDSICFPPTDGLTLNSMRQSEDGANYFLITGGDGNEYEYKTDAANRIEELRIYEPDGDDYILSGIFLYDIREGEAPTLPDRLIKALNDGE